MEIIKDIFEGIQYYYALAEYNERFLLKDFGFYWHDLSKCTVKNCFGCKAKINKKWWTLKYENVLCLSSKNIQVPAYAEFDEQITEIPVPIGKKYRSFQLNGIRFFYSHKNVLCGDDMGIGKTIQAIGLINYLLPGKVIIVSPKNLKFNWYSELKSWLTKNYKILMDDEDTIMPSIKIFNYEQLKKVDRSQRNELLIVDEAHFIKNKKTQRTNLVKELAENSGKIVFLTGTPIENRPRDLFSLLNILDPVNFDNKFYFEKKYCNGHLEEIFIKGGGGKKKKIWKNDGKSNTFELHNLLTNTLMIARKQSDVLDDLPKILRKRIAIEPKGNIIDHLKRELKIYLSQLKGDKKPSFVSKKIKYRAPKVDFKEFSKYRHKTGLMKVPYILKIIEEMEWENPFLIFCHHIDVAGKYADALKCPCVTSETNPDKRIELVKEFQANKYKTMAATTGTLGIGQTLTAADFLIMAELEINPGQNLQAEKRIARIGQKRRPNILYPMFIDSTDILIYEILVQKEIAQNEIITGETVSELEQFLGE